MGGGARLASVGLIALAIGCGSSSDRDDAGNGGDASTDAHIGSGQFGDPCQMHVDCVSGYCVEPAGGAGGQCSRTCNNDCPTGWDCLPVAFPEGTVRVCVPATGRLCNPCADDTECPGGACLTLDTERVCGSSCSSPSDCTTGYTCAPDPSGAHGGSFCQPVTGSCSCSAELAGAMRSCSTTSSSGTCWGTQTCSGTSGWGACSATTPSAEICDGIDNDCNFVIDDGVGGGEACTITNAAGTCSGVRTCSGSSGFVCNGQTPMTELCNSLDDNCNGAVDETFTGLGALCSAGIGGCLRYGSVRCDANGTGTVCGAVAGTEQMEMCNQIDDNCNGSIDETFTNLGQSCTAGLGVCTRYGTYVCKADTTNTECSATPGAPTGSETCNYLDDNCDGIVDNGYRDAISGLYTQDLNCGACGTDCTTVFQNAANATGGCVVTSTTATCGLRCNAGFFDLNAATPDGCEFQLDVAAIYVSTNDLTALDDSVCGLGPTGTGVGNHPCKTIATGIARATSTNRPRVLVADGTYNEPMIVANGRNMLGGYRADTWERHLATTSTIVQGVSPDGVHDRTVVAQNITSATLIEGFVIRGSFNTKAGGNSYAVYISASSAALTIRSNQIFGGRGGPGVAGLSGAKGTAGANGAAYSSGSYDSFQVGGTSQCSSTYNRPAYGGGVAVCGGTNGGGGNGGGVNCTPVRSTQNSTSVSPATAGLPGGGAGGGAGGQPGVRGYDAAWVSNTCYVPVNGSTVLTMHGSDGTRGGNGANAGGVTGCLAPSGSVVGGHWSGGRGNTGLIGSNGGGGGGGAAGAGADCQNCTITGGNGNDVLGGHGGGAGTGGCAGSGGGAGGAGGGVFGVFIVGGSAPTITTNQVTMGTGGAGGSGGIGGAGGLGGTGSIGGLTTSKYWCTGKGGRGGDGGDGGAGGGGGGGCGGGSYGFFTSGVGSPGYCGGNSVSGGAAGAPGSGGYSGGSPGGTGQSGVVQNCISL